MTGARLPTLVQRPYLLPRSGWALPENTKPLEPHQSGQGVYFVGFSWFAGQTVKIKDLTPFDALIPI